MIRTAPNTASSGLATWQWQLRRESGGWRTQRLVRQRLTYPPPRGMSVLWRLVEPVGFVMEFQMLLGIKRLTERGTPRGPR